MSRRISTAPLKIAYNIQAAGTLGLTITIYVAELLPDRTVEGNPPYLSTFF